ncbi:MULTISPECIES: response regulator [unclassified Lentimonas]|uniref:response regulator n=1 Tax=unclassified Lentimonas TaxID=2630993 RepID=UPI0013218EA1|nr:MULTISPECIES: response regulator [unclassified Lentimonas]CAA6693838.1 Unannotated [Lentimonas sp. CC19]CAA6695150.1 Unannotated [Lentimonas sp. CC10]CAA7069711.1 Unannotated [Lentimonas sp. CC11]
MAGRILVLDDEENYAEMLQDLLLGHNYQVDMATRPERAINQLEEIPYDLVISDYKMPVMDGADFLKKARELYPNLPFILVSGLMNTPELVKVANMSVTLVMEKPLDTEAFLSHVAKFADAMTEQEKDTLSIESTRDGSVEKAECDTYPEEPRFFSVGCAVSKRFMQEVWQAAQSESHVFILEPIGGDAALAVKDLSAWRGNLDKPIQLLDFEAFRAGGEEKVKELLNRDEMSDVISIRLSSPDQITEAKHHADLLQEVNAANNTRFIYLLESDMSGATFIGKTGAAGCVLPELRLRPTDVAQYARRVARLVADRSARSKPAEFSAEAVYALLAFEWPGNYQQVQDVISRAVAQAEDGPITLDMLKHALGKVVVPAPEGRIGQLVQQMQAAQFHALLASGESVEALARRLELGRNPLSEGDLCKLPLVNPKLANL